MPHIVVGPLGKLVKGDVLDVNKRALEARLKDLDSQLYMSWNPDRIHGHGCWELRRRPNEKTALHTATFQGNRIYELDYLETGTNHVKDFPYLNYKILEWVKSHDMWSRFNFQTDSHKNTDSYINRVETREKEKQADELAASRAQTKYEILQDRSLIKAYREKIASGLNPAEIARHWK